MSLAVIENPLPQLTQIVTEAELRCESCPDQAVCPIMTAEVAEEFRKFLLVIALCPQSRRLTSIESMQDPSDSFPMQTEPHWDWNQPE